MQSGNPDIREEVEKGRGLLKKIQLHVPLFKGYRKLEDIRVADELLRKSVSDVLQQATDSLQEKRSSLLESGDFRDLSIVGSQISSIQEFQGDVLHAQQGSTGISPAVRLDEGKLNALYEYDLSFIETSESIRELCEFQNNDAIGDRAQKISDAVRKAKAAWDARIRAVENVLLTQAGEK